jgi:hypothetical protein
MINRIKKLLFFNTFFILACNFCIAQQTNESYTIAKTQYEQGNYSSAIQNLKSIEYQIGANPKIQSLLIYSYVALKDYTNAKIELEKFKKLIGYKRTESIQAILTLETEINNGVKNADQNYRQNILSKRMVEARNIVDRGITANNNKRIALNNQFNNSKELATKNANPNDIASTLSTLNYSKKTELQKELRKEKKIRRAWSIQYTDKKMRHIAKLTFYEYNQNGDLIKYLIKEFGSVNNIAFSDFPLFEPKMITLEYIDELVNNTEFNVYSKRQVNPIKKDNSSTFQKVINHQVNKNKDNIYRDTSIHFQWKNNIGELVKDSVVKKNSMSISTYGKLNQSFTYYQNGQLSTYSFTEIYRTNNSSTEKTTYKSYEKNSVATSSSSTVKLFNDLDDVYSEKFTNTNISDIFKYDIYGNIQYQDRFFSSYGTTEYQYYFNFYDYSDGHKTPISEYNNQVNANRPSFKIYSKRELTENLHLGITNFKKSNLPEAKRYLSICLEADSSNIEYNYWMAKTYISAYAFEKAKNTINKILTLDPSFSPVYELMGNIYNNDYKTKATALEYYKLAAEWGVTSKIKTLEAYKTKFKLDKNLFEDEISQEPIEINNMIFEYDEEKKYYAKILKVDNRIDFQFLSTTDLNSGYGTSMEFKQSRKNPNLYIWKPNPNYRLIVTKNFIIYYFPDGNNLFKPVKL